MKNIEFSHSELNQLIQHVTDVTVKKTLMELGLLKIIFTRAEVEKIYGRARFEESKTYVRWIKKGEGRTSSVICQRLEFDEFMRKFKEELKPIQSKGIM